VKQIIENKLVAKICKHLNVSVYCGRLLSIIFDMLEACDKVSTMT